jgi:hypothetical protein
MNQMSRYARDISSIELRAKIPLLKKFPTNQKNDEESKKINVIKRNQRNPKNQWNYKETKQKMKKKILKVS